ncbi:restriction endonuclease subunit S [Halomonas alkalisoli]|uniref:restriction endonuclease subunit S n=1 Tax=Halomonas alkalisoli TaxID=2907158 RepID=UPI001F2E67FC|nr:restriction endonuclease subunit S [Halomonas alkalisoli]MCE9684440.1 restriction endonuclease subunit S [Halomonas alkalisoli]
MSWESRGLIEIADLTLGKMLDQKKNKGELLPYLANVNVRWGSFDLNELREMRFEPHEVERYGLQYGDIVMCEGGEPGRCAIWKEQAPRMMIQKALHRIRPKEGVDGDFLYYSLVNEGMRGRFSSLFTGSTIKHLPKEKLSKVLLSIPSYRDQKEISYLLSSYDELIGNNKRRIQLLEESAHLLYKEWFVHLRFPGHEHVKITNGVPEGWEPLPLGDLITLQRGFDLPVSKRIEGEVPIYASTGITGYHAEPKVSGPGVVTGRSGSLGQVMYVSCDYWPLNTTLWVKAFKKIRPHFARHLLAGLHLEQYNGGAAVPTLNRNDVHRIQVLLPPPMLLSLFEEQAMDFYRQVDILTKANERLARARDLLLPKLMSGELAA